jgi:hypothetical protein
MIAWLCCQLPYTSEVQKTANKYIFNFRISATAQINKNRQVLFDYCANLMLYIYGGLAER